MPCGEVFTVRTGDSNADMFSQLDRIESLLQTIAKQTAPKKPVQRKKLDAGFEFENFWSHYPVKKGKQAAIRAYSKLPKALRILIVADIKDRLANDAQWIAGYIPHASTYLNGERWTDEITPVTVKAETMPTNNDDLTAWAVGKGFRNPAPGESWNEYRRVVEQLYRRV